MISTRPRISKSSSPCTNLSVTIPRAPITIGITITYMLHSFFSVLKQGLDTYLTFRFCFFSFALWSTGMTKSTIRQVLSLLLLLLLLTITKRCPWSNGYRRRKWTRRHEFKSWTRLIAFHMSTITLGKGMNQIILPPAMGK